MYQEYKPSEQLRRKVLHYYVLNLSDDNNAPSTQIVTPDGCIELNFLIDTTLQRTNIDGSKAIIDKSYVVSRFRTHYYMRRLGAVKMIGVVFQPWQWGCYCDRLIMPDTWQYADELFGDITSVTKQLNDCATDTAIIRKIESYLLSLYHDNVNEIVAGACKDISAAHGILDMPEIYQPLGISQRRLQQLFKETIGISPKAYAKTLQFKNALCQLLKGEYNKLSDIAYQNSYTDQSHFIRDFKHFSGINPQQYIHQDTKLNDALIVFQ